MESFSIKARRGTESYLINALYSDYVITNKPCLPSNKTYQIIAEFSRQWFGACMCLTVCYVDCIYCAHVGIRTINLMLLHSFDITTKWDVLITRRKINGVQQQEIIYGWPLSEKHPGSTDLMDRRRGRWRQLARWRDARIQIIGTAAWERETQNSTKWPLLGEV